MKMKIYLITGLIALLAAGAGSLIDMKISFGILLSAGFSLLNMALLSAVMKAAISSEKMNAAALMIGSSIRLSLLLVVIYIALKNPQIFNMIGVAIGFTLFLVALLIDAVARKRG